MSVCNPGAPAPYVYFIKPIGQDGPIKIGCSHTPKRRLAELMVWSPSILEIVTVTPGDIKTEMSIHARFHEARLHGEWFQPCTDLLALIEGLKRGGTIPTLVDLTGPFPKKRCVRVFTPEHRISMSWQQKVSHAMRRSDRKFGDRFFPTDVVEKELRVFREAAQGGPPVPDGYKPVKTEEFIAAPNIHGRSYSDTFGRRAPWIIAPADIERPSRSEVAA
jgi:hypothetical protein